MWETWVSLCSKYHRTNHLIMAHLCSASFWGRLRNCAAACGGSTLERKGVAPLPTLTRSSMEKNIKKTEATGIEQQ